MSKKGSIFALLLSGRAMESRQMRNKIVAEMLDYLDQKQIQQIQQ